MAALGAFKDVWHCQLPQAVAERAALQLGFKGYAELEREEPFFDASTAVRTQQVASLLVACQLHMCPLSLTGS